jgi:hypothetical protein
MTYRIGDAVDLMIAGQGFAPPKRICPTHGEVDSFAVSADNGKYSSGLICPKCFADWVGGNITRTDPR